MKSIIRTDNAPAAIGPYSQGVQCGNYIFTSGQLPFNKEGGELESDPKTAARVCIQNCEAILKEKGASLEDVVKMTVFIRDMASFAHVNEVCSEFFSNDSPTRSCVEVTKLPRNAFVEIDMIAFKV